MAKDEVLFKFITSKIDPALLVDHNLQAEREALDLAEMSLLTLVDSVRMNSELQKSSEKIQNWFQHIYKEDVSKEFNSPALVGVRIEWLRARIDFYRRWLSVMDAADSSLELAVKAFQNRDRFLTQVRNVLEADKNFATEVIRVTNSLHRFLMKKQMDYELEKSKELWDEFSREAFHKPAELP